jgi:hypothetical protein
VSCVVNRLLLPSRTFSLGCLLLPIWAKVLCPFADRCELALALVCHATRKYRLRRCFRMKPAALLLAVGLGATAHAQLDRSQIDVLARMNCELSNGWTISDLHQTDFPIASGRLEGFSADLFTAHTSRRGNNEGVSLFFFERALSDSVEAHFASELESTYEFIETPSFIVVVAYFSSNGIAYDRATRDMLPELRRYFHNWSYLY